jgi:N-methylhydantoinase B
MAAPIYYRDQLVGFSGSIAHSPDIGGSLWAADCRELFEEGLRIPPTKFLVGGQPNREVFDFVLGNVRVPDQVLGDLYAQVSAQQVCARRLCEFLEDAGMPDLRALSRAMQERAERAMRRAIEAVPDGEYCSEVRADGFDEDETLIRCKVVVRGSDLHIDYAGTSKQIDRGLNSVMNYTYAYSVYPIKCALDPLTPRNEGSYRSVTVDAPLGSILNCRYPTPVNARQLTGHLLAGAIFTALAQVIPDKVIADCGGAPTCRALFSGTDRQGNRFSQILFASGGMGASHQADGLSTTAFPTNSGAGSIEAFESISPLIVWKKAFVPDSGGAGTFRGGLAQEVVVEVQSQEPLRISLLSDRQKYAAQGLRGGKEGGKVRIETTDGRRPHPKSRSMLQPGEKLVLRFGGGAGYGEPRERERERVLADVKGGYITEEAAVREYGVTP